MGTPLEQVEYRTALWQRVAKVYFGAMVRCIVGAWLLLSIAAVLLTEPEFRVAVSFLCAGVGLASLAGWFWYKGDDARQNSKYSTRTTLPSWVEGESNGEDL